MFGQEESFFDRLKLGDCTPAPHQDATGYHIILWDHIFMEFVVFVSGFPNAAVVDAYMKPTVDESMEAFTWAAPDVPSLREYPFTPLCCVYLCGRPHMLHYASCLFVCPSVRLSVPYELLTEKLNGTEKIENPKLV